MVFSKDILDAINILLVDNWAERPVYRGFLPKDFKRPSFYIVPVKETRRPGNCLLLTITGYYTIVAYEPINEYGVMDPGALIDTQTALLELFTSGKLAVGDRSLNVQVSAGGIDEGDAYVDLQAEYFRPRTDRPDTRPAIQEVTTTIRMEEQNGTSQF